mmetsp:Transcript_5989/g.8478  ORF Transcript_5989/g.8478 Transcript_5989/m.8478 type:complete len:85 (-) Transcript_5989:206-460(-)|eukprot:CAMPEP_0197294362 /NCGR_PEP_ID=MMETSP0890-20130614/32194_1 /TAXON_ID=44058 ORGANISM="Aureoumbra lagunensis, Strain CCMP1510" /NCGR_SAMPLE_ID=MMETSP0890 /ASSEMBLY_ACC=CAM_ASM_000533 /LENGTH=84 /DNA_ID=CAMNT_0042769735 /DNA_START=75 /DNA_END=329 /DNA_ORIENTATION=+
MTEEERSSRVQPEQVKDEEVPVVVDNPEFFDDPGDEPVPATYCMFACTGLFDTRTPDKTAQSDPSTVPVTESKTSKKYFPSLGF